MESGAIDDILSLRDHQLFVEDVSAAEIARRFGTPLYVISERGLRSRVRRFARAFATRWPEGEVHVLPSLKANFALALRHLLTQEGVGCDTFGISELQVALDARVPPELISVNGSSKDRTLLDKAVRAGARVTLDSEREVRLVREVARDLGIRARVRFRLRPDYTDLDFPSDFGHDLMIRDAAQAYKPGIPTEVLLQIGGDAIQAPELDVRGVMVHLGRHSGDLEVWRHMATGVGALIGQLSKAWAGWEPYEIDLGGGFPSYRDPTGEGARYERHEAARRPSQDIEAYAEALTGGLRDSLRQNGVSPNGKVLEVEPGRSLYADVGIHLATVRNIKVQHQPVARTWVETDTSEMFLLDTLIEHNRWDTLIIERPRDAPSLTADIVGISCGFDVIVPNAQLPEVREGDHIAFLATGAYQDATAANFNAMPRPGTVLVRGTEAWVIRRPETVEDVFRRDVVPEHLGSPGREDAA